MPLRAILFDVDDTITDWQGAIARAVTAAIVAHPHPDEGLPGRVATAVRERYWRSRDGAVVAKEHWRVVSEPEAPWAAALPGEPETATVLAAAFRAALRPQPFDDVHVIPKLARTWPLGLLSNNPRAIEVASRFGIAADFRSVVVAGAASIPAKPDPAAFVAAAEAMGCSPADTLLVAESAADVEGALDAGLVAAWLNRGGSLAAAPRGAHCIDSLHALPDLVARLSP